MILGTLPNSAAALPHDLAAAVATGDCARVLSELPENPGDGIRLAGAGCALDVGKPDLALALLEEASENSSLTAYEAWYRGRALAELGQKDETLAVLKGVVLPGISGRKVQLLIGRIHADQADPAAQGELAALADTKLAHEARFWAAEGLGVTGDSDGLIAGMTALWTDAAPDGWDTRAAERLRDLGHPVPEVETAEGRKRGLARVSSLRKANRHPEALELLLTIRELEPPRTDKERIALARAHASARKYKDALPYWSSVLGAADTATGTAQLLFDYALNHARTGDYDTSAIVYRRLIAQHPSSSQAEFASFKLGYMEYDRDNCETANELLLGHVKDHPDSKRLDEALWFVARCHWKAKDLDAASASLKRLAKERPKSSLVSAAAYWQARALGIAGDEAAEAQALRNVIRSWPTSGYAWFAAARTGKTFPARRRATPPEWPGSLAEKGAVIRAEALLAAGLHNLARAELSQVDPGSKRSAALALAWAKIRAGDYRGGQRLARPFCSSPWKGGDPVAQQACTPMPEGRVVATIAAEYDLDPLVPFGIMTAESALKPRVTSLAGARGLMQLMPELAGELHTKVFPERPYSPDDLYSAPYNVTLGTTELGQLNESLQDTLAITSLPAVIGSYNGGEEAVRRWLEGYETPPDFDEFSENISYTETRRYVKRVLGFVMTYRWVYGDPESAASEDVTAPPPPPKAPPSAEVEVEGH